LDTPGHEAFKGIRERGAAVADIAILVVSGEEGAKPQTIEALRYIETAKIPYIVAITKIDKSNTDAERVKQGLAEHKIFVEGYGGDTPTVPLSSKTGEGIAELLEMILLVADLHPVATDPRKPASGFVIESNCEQRSGISATLLIKDGTLRKGAFVAAEGALAPVRFIKTARGEKVSEAGTGQAVCVTGWNTIPRIGARFVALVAKKDAEKQTAAFSEKASRGRATRKPAGTPMENAVIIPVIIKADAGGSVEAVEHEIKKLRTEQVALSVIAKGIGALSESDLKTAASCRNPLIVGFNVGIDASAQGAFERSSIPFAVFDVIYKLSEWVAAKVKERTPKVRVEETSGSARILKLFSEEKDRQIIGGKVSEGELRRGDEFRVLRRDAQIGVGKIRELQHQKGKIEKAPKDSEFGALINATVAIAVGDRIEAFTIVER
jgi:translation initiation factor IF-2